MMLSSSSLVRARKASTPSMFSSSRMRWSVPSAWRTTVLSRISAMRAERFASFSKSLTLTPFASSSSAQVIAELLAAQDEHPLELVARLEPHELDDVVQVLAGGHDVDVVPHPQLHRAVGNDHLRRPGR